MRIVDLHWLPPLQEGVNPFRDLARSRSVNWMDLAALANSRLDFVQTNQLDKILTKRASDPISIGSSAESVRIAVLSSSTFNHLLPGIRVAGLRRHLRVQIHLGDYGKYLQEVHDANSTLYRFRPDVFLFAFHAHHLFGPSSIGASKAAADQLVETAAANIRQTWKQVRRHSHGQIIQQAIAPTYVPLVGSNEQRLPGSGVRLVERVNERLRELADEEGVDILAVDRCMAIDGSAAWHDPGLWHISKQEFSPLAGPAYGDLVMRLVSAQRGRSFKCLVLDLDNTLWGGVIGDDGVEGIQIGHGSARGEAFTAFQRYALDLSRRGIILAVCSKNDIDTARAPFATHPDMVLKNADVACFVANWLDKATNLHAIAAQLQIGLDSLVFVDENPFERNLVRRELPMVAVPEMPDDPAYFAQCISDAGYFEAVRLTAEDFGRCGQYRASSERGNPAAHTDVAGYLQSLNMELRWAPIDRVALQRVVQLSNKTNQFNLRTHRYTEPEVLALMHQPGALTLQLRLVDRFGDNGIIGVVIGVLTDSCLKIDAWLMSCRVLGRQVEQATMNLIVEEALKLGAREVLGEYLPTKKNGMVRDLYQQLGFSRISLNEVGASQWVMPLHGYIAFAPPITILRSGAHE